jgi:murein DD-endopeptidase MepM/ murein hydrolase activator NlpD
LAAAFVVPGAATSAVSGQAESDGRADLEAEYDEILGREAVLVARVEEARAERLRLTAELEQLNDEMAAAQGELLGAEQDLDEAERRARRTTRSVETAESEVEAAEERLQSQIVASYVTGGSNAGLLEAILTAGDSDDAGQVIAYSRAVVDDSDTLVRELEAARASQRAAEESARTAEGDARTRRSEVGDAVSFLSDAVDRQHEILDEVDVQVLTEARALQEVQDRAALVRGRIDAMQRASDALALTLAAQQAEQAERVPAEIAPDEVPTNPIPGYGVGSGFGPRRHPILDITRLHAGSDLTAPSGTPIHAVDDGVVAMAGVNGGYGETVVVDHGDSLSTLSAHMSRIDVGPGDIVQRGDVIGLVGSTGLSTGPHLHFETRIKGVPVDPERVVDFDAPVDYGNGN